MPCVGFEHTFPVFERAKTVHALHHSATVTGEHKVFFIASGVGLSPLYYGHFWPIVPAPNDRRG
jgi:hypothetical protein